MKEAEDIVCERNQNRIESVAEKLSQMDRQGNLRKELPFTVGLPVSLMNADTQAEDTVVVQGIIDI